MFSCRALAGFLFFLVGSVFFCWEDGFLQLKVAPKNTQNTFTQSWMFKLDQQSLVSEKHEMTRKSLSSGEAEFYVLNVHFPSGKKQILKTHVFNNMHVWSIHSLKKHFSLFQDSMYFDSQKGPSPRKKVPFWWAHFRVGPPHLQKAPFRPQKWTPNGYIPSLGGAPKGQS